MNSSKLSLDTEAHVKQKMSGESTGHDWFHVDRVRKNALLIARGETDVDLTVIELAALLHDIGDWKTNVSEKSEETILRETCDSLNYPHDLIEQTVDIILNMSYSKNLSGKKTLSREGMIVQDADRLDGLGAIGIARAFAYGGKKEREIYNPDIQPVGHTSTESYRNAKGTTVNHFYEKLFLLRDQLNTETAKEIAQDRESFMRDYLKEFLAEWNGER